MAIVVEPVAIIEPKWTPLEIAMWEAGMVPVKHIGRQEAEAMYPHKESR